MAVMIRYILHPGWVESWNDGDRHYIDAPKLARLYGVPWNQCIVHDPMRPETRAGFVGLPTDKHLWPRKDGRY